MKIVFVASIIRNSLCIIYGFYYFFQKSLFTENYFLVAAIDLATLGPLYTCLVTNQIEFCTIFFFQLTGSSCAMATCQLRRVVYRLDTREGIVLSDYEMTPSVNFASLINSWYWLELPLPTTLYFVKRWFTPERLISKKRSQWKVKGLVIRFENLVDNFS